MSNDSTIEAETSDALSAPRWFLVVSIIALLWFVMDMTAFFSRVLMSTDTGQQFPLWVNIVFAGEVFGGTLGCVALLLKKKWAMPVFVVSILGVLSQTTYIWFISDAISQMGAPAVIAPLVSILIGLGMIVLTKTATSKNWLT